MDLIKKLVPPSIPPPPPSLPTSKSIPDIYTMRVLAIELKSFFSSMVLAATLHNIVMRCLECILFAH